MPLSKDEFLTAAEQIIEREIEDVGVVCFRVMGGTEMEAWTERFDADKTGGAAKDFAASVMVEKDGTRFYDDDHLSEFRSLSYPLQLRCALAALAAHGLDSEELAELEKKSEAGTNGQDGSG